MARLTRMRRRLSSQRGAELVEFALVLPVLLVLMAAIVDMGFLFKDWEVVTNAAREGARAAALPGWVESDVETRVTNYLNAGGLDGSLATTSVDPVTITVGARTVTAVKVSVSFPHSYLVLGPLVQMAAPSGQLVMILGDAVDDRHLAFSPASSRHGASVIGPALGTRQ